MRILHALSQTELTGSEAYAQDLVSYQTQQGHFCLTVSDRLHLPFAGETFFLSLSTSSFRERIRNIFRLRRLLREKEIDVIHCHSRGACRHLYWASRGLKIPILTTLHGYQHSSWSKRRFDIYGDYVLAVCEKIRDQLVANFRRDPSSLEVLRNPTSFEARSKSAPRAPTVLLAGRSSGPKGRRLRELFAKLDQELSQHFPEVRLHLVLSGFPHREIESFRARHPRPQVRIEGHLPGLREALEEASLVVASGRIALEALALGRPVFAFGEADQPGLVQEESLSAILASNFGDVGPETPLRCEDLVAQLYHLIKHPPAVNPELQKRLRAAFDRRTIQERILDLYRGLRLFKRARWIPILMYHKVVEHDLPGPHRTFITVRTWHRHLRFFLRMGFTTLRFQDLSDFWFERRPLKEFPCKPLVLTFDDGYRNNLTHVVPSLQTTGQRAEIFLLADAEAITNTWDMDQNDGSLDLMTLEEKKSLPLSLYGIGSHGLSHRHFPELTNAELRTELWDSKQNLENQLGAPVVAFATPFGDLDDRVPALAAEAGYDFAVNTDRGPKLWFTDRYSLFRVNIFPEDGPLVLWKKTSSWYRDYYFRKRGR